MYRLRIIEMNIPTKVRVKTENELAYEKEVERFKNSYLFINTNFKRKSEPIFALACMESKRRVFPQDIENLYFKSDEEILKVISQFVQEDYFTCDGRIKLWGQIYSYIWHHVDGKRYVFQPDGDYRVSYDRVNERAATLSIKGKNLC